MSTLNIIVVVAIVVLVVLIGVAVTVLKFKNIESGETDRRKHIEEDMEVEDRKSRE